jgi:hypothetical protein
MRADPSRRVWRAAGAIGLLASLVLATTAAPALAASSSGCEGGGYTVLGRSGVTDAQVQPTAAVFRVQGTYNQFDVVAATFEVRDYAFLPTDNALDMTNGVLTPVWASKNPLHGGTLTSPVTVVIDGENLELQRHGTTNGAGLTMTITAKDCAQGGIFQMEVERDDIDRATGLPTKTPFVHRLADAPGALRPFYFDNQNFRDNIGRFLTRDSNGNNVDCVPDPANRFCVRVAARTNIGNAGSKRFVARDSAQGGVPPNDTVRVNHPECGSPQVPTIDHCGGVSVWLVASGGRMGFVTGVDAVEVANPPTQCIQNCQAQNRVRGRLAVLGSPFPVAADDKLEPRLCTPVRPACPL